MLEQEDESNGQTDESENHSSTASEGQTFEWTSSNTVFVEQN